MMPILSGAVPPAASSAAPAAEYDIAQRTVARTAAANAGSFDECQRAPRLLPGPRSMSVASIRTSRRLDVRVQPEKIARVVLSLDCLQTRKVSLVILVDVSLRLVA